MLTADAFATLYLVQPVRRLASRPGLGVPILMYHSVSDPEDSHQGYFQTTARPAVFAEHMKFLHDEGYRVVGIGEVPKILEDPRGLDTRPVAITFDDGFEDFYTHAFPALEGYGFKATMYLPTAYIGEEHITFKGRRCMSWSQVREIGGRGIEIGSHTVTHPLLKFKKLEDVRHEIRSSKDTIEYKLGKPVTSFAYPYAFPETDRDFRERLRGFLEEAGYENGVSTILGTASRSGDRYFMKRLPANSRDDLRLFRAKLEGGYDWLHTVQYASKFFKA